MAWHYANEVNRGVFVVKRRPSRFDLRVRSIDGSSVVLEPTPETNKHTHLNVEGVYGLEWAGGYARVGKIRARDKATVTRSFLACWGASPQRGDAVRIDASAYPPNPKIALCVDYEDVSVASPHGPLPAWFVPGTHDTWVLFVHGKGSSRAEALRALKATSAAGYPGLAITYRNDPGVSLSYTGRYDYGESEWEDLDSAITYAKAHGARKVVLVGFSMGGSIVLSFTERSERMCDVAGIILDSPLLCLGSVLGYHGAAGHMPSPVVQLTKDLIRSRFGVDWSALDYRTTAEKIEVPLRIIHGAEDTVIPVEHSRAYARSRPGLFDMIEVPGARHVGSWNVQPEAYEKLIVDFINQAAQRR